MTLDEAIEREEAFAYSYGERYKRGGEPVSNLDELEAEHKQLADWLTELKQLREQTSALDKARAEIAAYGSIWVEYSIPGYTEHDIEKIVKNVLKQAKEQVLKVIDKYKAESGGKE